MIVILKVFLPANHYYVTNFVICAKTVYTTGFQCSRCLGLLCPKAKGCSIFWLTLSANSMSIIQVTGSVLHIFHGNTMCIHQMSQHFELWIKWLMFCRQHFHMQLLKDNYLFRLKFHWNLFLEIHLIIRGVLCQKRVSRARTSNYILQVLWDVIA